MIHFQFINKINWFCLSRMESINIKQLHGLAKVLGSVVGVSGALVFAFVKGPPINFMHRYTATEKPNIDSIQGCSTREWIKGSLIMLSANTFWSLWLILQVFPWAQMMVLLLSFYITLLIFCFSLHFSFLGSNY